MFSDSHNKLFYRVVSFFLMGDGLSVEDRLRSKVNGRQAGGMTPCKQKTLEKTQAQGLI